MAPTSKSPLTRQYLNKQTHSDSKKPVAGIKKECRYHEVFISKKVIKLLVNSLT